METRLQELYFTVAKNTILGGKYNKDEMNKTLTLLLIKQSITAEQYAVLDALVNPVVDAPIDENNELEENIVKEEIK